MSTSTAGALVVKELVRLAATPADKTAAIREACQLLSAAGCIAPDYEASMQKREAVANTFLGHGVSIPHGLGEDRDMVKRDGIAILQIPGGIEWNPGQTAKLVVAIAARSDTHITILRRLTRLIQDDSRLAGLFTTDDAAAVMAALLQDEAPATPAAAVDDLAQHFTWTVDYPVGLHARPAAAWVETARHAAVRMQVRHDREVADPRNLVALLQLGLRAGDSITVSAEGDGAQEGLARLRATIIGLSAQEKADAAKAAAKAAVPVRGWTPPGNPTCIAGIGASPGVAIGSVHRLAKIDADIPDLPGSLAEGGDRLHQALDKTRSQLVALIDDTTRRLGAQEAKIFKAQGELLNDSDLITLACQLMVEGHGVAWSWNQAVERMAAQLSALDNPVLAARAADLRDVGRRVLGRLHPALANTSLSSLPDHPVIILATDLSPSDTAGLDKDRVIGLVTAQGGPTAHTAILARTLGLPAVVAAGPATLEVADGTRVIIDGDGGRLYLTPSAADLASAAEWIAERERRRAAEEAERGLPARTLDGHTVTIGANVNLPDQVPLALKEGAEGVGLMRTEFLFLERGATPTEDEQYATYRAMIEALQGRPLIVRALDIGGDKQVAHLDLPREDNPFLGVRGARLLLRRPDLLEPQLRALYRAATEGGELSIMFPMVTSAAEVIALRAVCERIRSELNAPVVPIGIMIEVPAAALAADMLAGHVDFFSIGTNDLTQYALAIDRQNPELAGEADSLHPAVLRLIRQTVEGAKRHHRWVGVCGGIAGDPFGAALLAGLGVNELSMTPREIPAVKARLRASDHAALQALAEKALAAASAEEVRALDAAAWGDTIVRDHVA